MNKQVYNDIEIIKMIKAGGNETNKALEYIMYDSDYKAGFISLIQWGSLTEEDVEDYFQETLYQFLKSIRKDSFNQKSSLKTYFLGIAKNINRSQYSKNQNRKKLLQAMPDRTELNDLNIERKIILKEKEEILENVFALVGSKCRLILSMSYANYKVKDILEKSGYKNIGTLRKEKSLCLSKLKQHLKDNPKIIKALIGYV